MLIINLGRPPGMLKSERRFRLRLLISGHRQGRFMRVLIDESSIAYNVMVICLKPEVAPVLHEACSRVQSCCSPAVFSLSNNFVSITISCEQHGPLHSSIMLHPNSCRAWHFKMVRKPVLARSRLYHRQRRSNGCM